MMVGWTDEIRKALTEKGGKEVKERKTIIFLTIFDRSFTSNIRKEVLDILMKIFECHDDLAPRTYACLSRRIEDAD
jgi:hypothetical protein